MKIDKTSSERLDIIKLPLIIGVVFIHAYDTQLTISGQAIGLASSGWLSLFIRDLISQNVARIAVPLFFLISGFLFFLNFNFSTSKFIDKIKSRAKTLLVPFLFWNISVLILLAVVQSIPATKSLVSGQNLPVSTYGIFDFFKVIFGIGRFPISYQFWFIRDLMLIVILTPIVSILLKYLPHVSLVAFLALWFSEAWPFYSPSASAVTFYYFGAYLAKQNKSLFALDQYSKYIITCYVSLLILSMVTRTNNYHIYIHNLGILFGCACALYLTKRFISWPKIKHLFLWGSKISFFVFAAHEPLLSLLRKLAYKFIAPESDLTVLALYFMIPIVTILFCIALYLLINRLFPKFLSIITGSR